MQDTTTEQNPTVDKELLRLEKVIDVKSLKDNSILVFRSENLDMNTYKVIEALNYLYGDIFKQKNVTYLVLKNGTNIEELSERKMNEMGWHKKGGIITLN